MWNLIFLKDTNEFIYKIKRLTDIKKQPYGYQRWNEGGGINQEFVTYTHYYVK